MGRRGPPKTPTALKIMRGCPSGRNKLPKGEAKPELVKGSVPPDGMSLEGKAVWEQVAPKLEELGLLSVLDGFPFRRYCELMARWLAASRKITESGQTHLPIFHNLTDEERAAGVRPKLKYLQELPEAIEFRQLPEKLLKLEQQFGMTPASRAAIQVLPNSKNAPTDIESFLYGGNDRFSEDDDKA